MRWKGLRRRKGGVIDRRGQRMPVGAGGLGLPVGVGGGAIGIVLLVVVLAFQLCGGGGLGIPGPDDLGGAGAAPAGQSGPDPDARLVEFMDAVVDDIQTMWDVDIFQPAGRRYEDTDLVLFTERTQSGCGPASSATGPFYCPADRLMYLDLGFFRELDRRFGAPGDFAQAYVIAHEVGHHVQTLLGTNAEVQRRSREEPELANELSVRLELQADCYAGVWGHSVFERSILDTGEVEEGIAAAEAVGDDRIQEQTQGRIDPESFTHGTSEQRATWFRTGFDSGDPADCDTFNSDI
ncbi:MAG: KPN_02809 family neutral zinc metallopeptidase [Actinomycetota bacterium]